METIIKFNSLNFSNGNKESERSKKNLLVNNTIVNAEEDSNKFTLETEILDNNVMNEEIKVDFTNEASQEEIKKIKTSKSKTISKLNKRIENDNELALANNNISLEKIDPIKNLNIKKLNDNSDLQNKNIKPVNIKKIIKTNDIENITDKNYAEKNQEKKKY